MGLAPKIEGRPFKLKTCSKCGQTFGVEGFAPTSSPFYPDHLIPWCNDCIDKEIVANGWNWEYVDKLCQWVDIPFVPKEWEKLREMNSIGVFFRYATIFQQDDYETIGWKPYFDAFSELQKQGTLEEELPLISDKRKEELRQRWGANYDMEALRYMDDLYIGLLATQNVNGKLQKDQAEKICKISYEIDLRIREGADFDKLLASYDRLVKAADFTPKNVKNINDFDTCGELIKWLEKKGWQNSYYDDVPKDIVDETIANIQAFNQRLYVNESGIGEEITNRLQNLKQVEKLEQGNYYSTESNISDLDKYEVDGYDKLFKDEEEEDFVAELGVNHNEEDW